MNHEIQGSHEKETGTDFLNRMGHALLFRVWGKAEQKGVRPEWRLDKA
jgi:hypothetical protein